MKIHHLINDIELANGGAQRIVRFLHIKFLKSGIDSQIVTLNGFTDDLPAALSLGSPKYYSWRSFWRVIQYVKNSCKPGDIIHVHLFPMLFYVALSVKLIGWKGYLVCTEHSTNNRRRQCFLGKMIDHYIYSVYCNIYCISEGVKASLEEWMPSQKSKLKVIENGCNLPCQRFKPREVNKKIILASAGRLQKPKNYPTILKAMSLLKDVDFEYRIAGIGSEEQELRLLSSQLHLDGKVKFYGYVENIFHFFEEADIFLLCSSWEGFGLAAVEAMNTSLPVIASNVIGLREIIDTEVNPCGILVSPDHPEEIAGAISSLMDYNKRFTFSKNAFEQSLKFSSEAMAKNYNDAYKKLRAPE